MKRYSYWVLIFLSGAGERRIPPAKHQSCRSRGYPLVEAGGLRRLRAELAAGLFHVPICDQQAGMGAKAAGGAGAVGRDGLTRTAISGVRHAVAGSTGRPVCRHPLCRRNHWRYRTAPCRLPLPRCRGDPTVARARPSATVGSWTTIADQRGRVFTADGQFHYRLAAIRRLKPAWASRPFWPR